MNLNLTGATRLNIIVGDPIKQVKSPGGMTRAFADRGHDGILVPVQVSVEDLGGFLAAADKLRNLDAIVVTVPHKFACFRHCKSATDRAT
jgi:shikimate dehydrogenase